MLNNPLELWVVLRTIGVYPSSLEQFKADFCECFMHPEYGVIVTGLKNVERLRALLDRVMLRRTFYEVNPDAPRPTWATVDLDPTLTAPEDIAELVDAENHPRAHRVIAAALRKAAAGEMIDWQAEIPSATFASLRRVTAAAKTKPAAHWIRTRLASGETDKLVVFAHHSGMIDALERDLAPFGAAAIRGSTKDRQARIDRFKTEAGRRVLICQDQIARTAIDLSVANTLFFAETDPVPNNNLQAAMRVQGLRQTHPVLIFAGNLPGSSDEQITKINVRKTLMEADIFGC